MAVKISSNIASLAAQRQLGEVTSTLGKVYERLSSGQRINRSSDDAAGLAIAKTLDANARIFGQAMRNINDGISMCNIAESTLGAMRDISQRQLELAEQATSGTYSLTQRQAMNSEMNKLVDEYNRISQSSSFNGLTVLNASSGSVTIQAGVGTDGAIAFSPAQELSRNVGTGSTDNVTALNVSSPTAVATGDFNGDGNVDFAMTPYGGGLSLYFGDGQGGFTESGDGTQTSGARAITATDFNTDGNMDLIVVYEAYMGTPRNKVELLRGSGDGTFSSAITEFLTVPGNGSLCVTVNDFNSDGRPDFAIGSAYTQNTSVFMQNSSGTFAVAQVISGAGGSSIVSADMDGDEILDLVTNSSGGIATMTGKRDGTFALTSIVATTGTSDFEVADMNGDGIPDIVGVTGSRVSVLLGNGNGTFRSAVSVATANDSSFGLSVAVADMNGDGYLDIIDGGANSGFVWKIETMLGNGDGSFRARSSSSNSSNDWGSAYGMTLADFNNDQRLDIVDADYLMNNAFLIFGTGSRVTTIAHMNICTRLGAYQAIGVVNQNLNNIQSALSQLGAVTSRFAVALNTTSASRENTIAASSRITDADMGEEAANLTRTQIVQQAAASVLAQANLEPQITLRLLKG